MPKPAARTLSIDYRPLAAVKGAPRNPKAHDLPLIRESFERFGLGDVAGIIDERTGRLVAGHGRIECLREMAAVGDTPPAGVQLAPDGSWLVPILTGARYRNPGEAMAFLLAHNRTGELGGWDEEELALALGTLDRFEGTGFAPPDPTSGVEDDPDLPPAPALCGNLSRRFGLPPVTLLDARAGRWRDRKRAWLDLGIKSEEGRAEGLMFVEPPNLYTIKVLAEQAEGRPMTIAEVKASPWGAKLGAVTSTSVFDPVLCEVLLRWYSAPGSRVVDPWAGGSVRGIVSAAMHREYTGIELRPEQVKANRAQWKDIGPRLVTPVPPAIVTDPAGLTPVEVHAGHYVKRDDLFALSGMHGGKVRVCLALATAAQAAGAGGLVTAAGLHSAQAPIVAAVAAHLGMQAECYVPAGDVTPAVAQAQRLGAIVYPHPLGSCAEAAEAIVSKRVALIPPGMEDPVAVTLTAAQVANVPECERIVVAVASGLTLAGIVTGLDQAGNRTPVLGVIVGAHDPRPALDQYAPGWEARVELVDSGYEPADLVPDDEACIGGLHVDPAYEAKALGYLNPGDLLWIVGHRDVPAVYASTPTKPTWRIGDSTTTLAKLPAASFDMALGCPPYYDLERYSDLPADLSTLSHPEFEAAMHENLAAVARVLAPDSFAVFVVGNVRDHRSGLVLDMDRLMVNAAEAAGLHLINDAVFVTPFGSIVFRAGRPFEVARTLSRCHQSVLVFVKGDRRAAAARLGEAASLGADLDAFAIAQDQAIQLDAAVLLDTDVDAVGAL